MKTFVQYVSENTEATNAFQKAKTIASYIKFSKYRELYLEALDELEKAAKEKVIYNARFGEHKYHLMRGIEYGYSSMFDTIKQSIIDSKEETSGLWSITILSDIKKVHKEYLSMNTKNAEAIKFMESIKDIPDALKTMKTYVQSGKPPKEPKPGQFIKPMASLAASKLAVSFMTEATDSFAKELKSSVTRDITDSYKKIKDITDPTNLPNDATSTSVESSVFILRRIQGKKVLELKPDSDKIVERMISDTVKNIIDNFIAKNSSKLALILEKKNTPRKHKLLKTNIRNGMVENSMEFEFEDGSSFLLESSVIYKYSKTGKLFFQFPTRFKDVKMADGSKMSMPSEEKMIKEF